MAFLRRNQTRRSSPSSYRWQGAGCEQLESREMKTASMELGFTAPPVETAAAYIKFDGIDGESRDADHGKWTDVLSLDQPAHKTRAAYLRFDGIDGESKDADHGKWIDLISVGQTAPETRAAFLKLDGIDGEATDHDHDKWVKV